jgi:hypothetical protein
MLKEAARPASTRSKDRTGKPVFPSQVAKLAARRWRFSSPGRINELSDLLAANSRITFFAMLLLLARLAHADDGCPRGPKQRCGKVD